VTRILYSTDSAEIDTAFPVEGGLASAWRGEVVARISDLRDAENALERGRDAQHAELHERVRRAATRTTALNERFLRRISAELHDGPAQDLGLALLRLDHVSQPCEASPSASGQPREEPLEVVQSSLRRALQELRAILAGLGVPQLAKLSLPETVARVVRAHERRTGTKVAITLGALPDQVPLPVKITLYRVIQEALSNAYRHADGVDQQVRVGCAADILHIEVADGGPGVVGPLPTFVP
jgi:signal transduction histidine kinase